MNNLDTALGYAKKGLKIFPCNIDKTPKTENGFKNASNDPAQIKKWWSEHPDASIGLPCGEINGLWVLDIDLPDGPKNFAEIERKYGRIPSTLTQRTGGGGVQYFWKWNGHDVRNSTSKIGKNIDVRGTGGYVILPPSSHPSGGQYEWLKRDTAIAAPDWLADLATTPVESKQSKNSTSVSSYGQAALAGELVKIAGAPQGTRNETLNASAYSLGQLVGGGELDQAEVEASLLGVAMGKGLPMKEARATIKSGIESGMKSPRTAPRKEEDYHFDFNGGNQSNQSNQSESKESPVITGNQSVIKTGENGIIPESDDTENSPYNLHCLIGEWIKNSTGYFTNEQVDREFNLTSRKEKVNRAKSLFIYKEKELIRADKKIKGRWHVIDSNIEWVDLNNIEDRSFPVELPLGIHEKVAIPPKSIIIVAGTTNAGKTAALMDTLKRNRDQAYGKLYLMSEMGGSEYKHRVRGTGVSINEWNEKIKAAVRSYDFNSTIQNYNPDGLTCIDYLEEIDGEYFKIASSIRDIYDSLGDGVAMIAIQKKSLGEFGRGGEATAEKARLYMTIDFLCSFEHSIVCALKIVKAKQSINENMTNKEIHFKIEKGSCLTPITDWMHSSKVNRATCIDRYERNEGISHPYIPYKFNTVEGVEVTLNQGDYEAWKLAYGNADLDSELRRVVEYGKHSPWLKKKGWFQMLGGHLDKKFGLRR